MLTTKNVDRSKLSEMLLDYVKNKDNYPDDFVFFRVGDFFEAYFEDALPLSQVTGVRLTAKKIGSKNQKDKIEDEAENVNIEELKSSQLLIPMAGVPYHTLMSYSNQMINAGKRVVVVEQLEDPKKVKGRNVKRGVVCILSTQDLTGEFVAEYLNNYICILYKKENLYGLTFSDISTGEVFCTYTDNIQDVYNEISRYKPSEIVTTMECENYLKGTLESRLKLKVMLTIDDSVFESNQGFNSILSVFNISNIDDLKYNNSIELMSLLGLIQYIGNTQMVELKISKLPIFYRKENYLEIDSDSRIHLELTENVIDRTRTNSLLSVLDKCKTCMGSRLLKQWIEKPLQSKSQIENRQMYVDDLVLNYKSLDSLRESLIGILDISRIMGKLKRGTSIPRDLLNLRESLRLVPSISRVLESLDKSRYQSMIDGLRNFDDFVYLLDRSLVDDPSSDIREGIVIKSGYNKELDISRDMERNANKYLREFEESEREKTGIKNLKVCNKNGRCLIEVTNTNLSKVPNYYKIEKSLKNSNRYSTEILDKLEKDLLSAMEHSKNIEIELYEEIKRTILMESSRIQYLCDVISTIDVYGSLAFVARENEYRRPSINNSGILNIINGKHPVLNKILKGDFVSNNTQMNLTDNKFLLLTGPNMAGKSTYMRQIALIVIMAHIGSYVPADLADICIIDKIFTRIGASDDIASGRSTYMVEMTEVRNILEGATKNSLVLLDEVGRGTSTLDGLAIAEAISKYICNNIGCKTLFATHYHELISLEDILEGFKNYHFKVEKNEKGLTFVRKLESGGLSESYGIDVAELAGLPKSIVEEAHTILSCLTTDMGVKRDNYIKNHNDSNKEIIDYLKTLNSESLTPINSYKILLDVLERLV